MRLSNSKRLTNVSYDHTRARREMRKDDLDEISLASLMSLYLRWLFGGPRPEREIRCDDVSVLLVKQGGVPGF